MQMLFHNHLLFFSKAHGSMCAHTQEQIILTYIQSPSLICGRERDRKRGNLSISYKTIGGFQIRISRLSFQTQQINKDKK